MKTGRRDGRESYAGVLEDFLPDRNDSVSLVLSRFQSVGIDVEGTVALLGDVLSKGVSISLRKLIEDHWAS